MIVVGVLLAVTGAVGVLGGFIAHWIMEAWALRPAYRADRAARRSVLHDSPRV